MSETETKTDDGSPKLLRRTVIKMTAAGVAAGAAGGSLSGSAAAQESGEAEIVIPAQETQGFQIEIETATMPDGGFISLVDPVNPHEKMWPEVGERMPSEEAAIDSMTIGTTEYLEAGTHENVTIELDEQLDFDHNVVDEFTGKLYQVWMHRDTDGDQEFTNVAPGPDGENRYTYEQEGQHRAEVNEIVVGEAYLEHAAFNPATVQDQIQANEQRVSELESQISELQSANENYEERISELESERDRLQSEIDDLNETVSDLQNDGGGGNSIPGFGIITGIAGAAVGAAAAARRFGGDDEE